MITTGFTDLPSIRYACAGVALSLLCGCTPAATTLPAEADATRTHSTRSAQASRDSFERSNAKLDKRTPATSTPDSQDSKPGSAPTKGGLVARTQAKPAPQEKILASNIQRVVSVPASVEPEKTLPANSPVPGGIAIITVGAVTTARPVVTYGNAAVYVTRRGNYWVAAVGVPLKADVGQHSVLIKTPEHPDQKLLFDVVAHKYKSQSLTIANKRKVNPNPKDTARIERDWVHIQKAKTAFNTHSLPDLKLAWPLKGRISSEFGLRRIYNGQPRSPHSGLDIAAPTGTAITAPSAGTVIETGDFFFNGQTAFVDHGHGLVTMYCHMSKIEVNVGDVLNTGELIGLVGETGRVTGPHLHLGVLLNGEMVNPTLLLSEWPP